MPRIRQIHFRPDKYGPELLVDTAPVSRLKGFVLTPESHTLSFYDILLITRGRGKFWLDDTCYPVKPGRVIFTSPGQVRRLEAQHLEGLVLFFTGAFLERFLSDPLVLYRLPYFHRDRVPELALAPSERRLLARRLREMEAEIGNLRGDSSPLLGARLYEVLMLLTRWLGTVPSGVGTDPGEGLGLRFRRLVERHHRRTHRVAGYAGLLSVSASHLNAMVRRQLGRPPLELIQDRLALEARRLLLHTDETAARIGYALGFADPSYFARFFRRRTGLTPTAFRAGAL
jgi:AraC-like DNA-binding protein/mannose-6-phosphate isomerase-like protein (cupin superfamily)